MADNPVRPDVASEYYINPTTGQKYVLNKLGGTTTSDGSDAGLVDVYEMLTKLAGERNPGTSNEYGVGVPECNYTVVDEADGTDIQISSGVPALLFGYYVNEVLAGGTIILQDDTTAVITIPAGGEADVGSFIPLPGIKFNNDLTCNCAAGLSTGNITICWRPQ